MLWPAEMAIVGSCQSKGRRFQGRKSADCKFFERDPTKFVIFALFYRRAELGLDLKPIFEFASRPKSDKCILKLFLLRPELSN